MFLLSPNRQHERTVGHLEVSRTKNQITHLAFQVFKTTMFRKIPPGGFPGRKKQQKIQPVSRRGVRINKKCSPYQAWGSSDCCALLRLLQDPFPSSLLQDLLIPGPPQHSPTTLPGLPETLPTLARPPRVAGRPSPGNSRHGFFPEEQTLKAEIAVFSLSTVILVFLGICFALRGQGV